jgi:glycosyltransferase involved in cell wall biosynthesis
MPLTPLASVSLPVYNGQPYFRDAVQSILDRTFEKF